ncbi:MAG: hypothetical protein IPI65_00025 [Bacteroidetes bacterium]|nr:hypothetical protein [Bacteroidota bacterium]
MIQNWLVNLLHKDIHTFKPQIEKDVKDCSDRINTLIKANYDSKKIYTAIMLLLALDPSDESLSIDRKEISTLVSGFYRNENESKSIESWSSETWEQCDKWIIIKLITDLEKKSNVPNLYNHLQTNSLDWLNNLVQAISKLGLENHMNHYSILPNQNGEFRLKKDLSVDDKIDLTLKAIAEELELKCKHDLLANEIKLELDGKKLTSREIANKISEKVTSIYSKDLGKEQRRKSKSSIFFNL